MVKLTTLEERFLTSYFQIELLVGKFISDEEKDRLFTSLANIYLIAEEKRAELSSLKDLDAVKSIGSNYEYNLHRRIVTFNRLTNYESHSEDELYVCDIKGRSATTLEELGFNFVLDTTSPAVVRFLTNTSGQGALLSMRILGTLQTLGSKERERRTKTPYQSIKVERPRCDAYTSLSRQGNKKEQYFNAPLRFRGNTV